MRESDRQSNREARERTQRHADAVVRVAHRLGGKATAVTHDDVPGVVTGTLEGACIGCHARGVAKELSRDQKR